MAPFQRRLFVVDLLLAAAAIIVLVTPVMYHRLLFGRGMTLQVVERANVLPMVGATLGALAVCKVLLLICDLVLGRGTALVPTGAYLVGALWLFYGMALVRRAGGG